MNAVLDRVSDARYCWRRIDPLVRTIIANWILGIAVGQVCVALLLAFDFAGIGSLLWRSDVALAGTFMLCAGFAITFGGLVSAAAVMTFDAGGEPSQPRGGLRQRIAPRLRLAPVAVAVRRGR